MTLRLQALFRVASAVFAGIAIYEMIEATYELSVALSLLAIWLTIWAQAWRPRK